MDNDLKRLKFLHDKTKFLQELRTVAMVFLLDGDVKDKEQEDKIINEIEKIGIEINEILNEAKEIYDNYR
jgi:hypothetical protein